MFRVSRGDTRAPDLRLAEMPRLGEIEAMPLCFGPKNSDFSLEEPGLADGLEAASASAVDRMHVNIFHGGALCDYTRPHLSDLLCAEGDVLEWVHDLGYVSSRLEEEKE